MIRTRMALILALFLLLPAMAVAAPKAVFPETAFTFEPVPDGTQIVHEFVVQNKGDAVLKVTDVKTS